jgi:hypothetical protein
MEEHEADKQRKAATTKQRRQKEASLASSSLLDATRSRNISIALKRFTKYVDCYLVARLFAGVCVHVCVLAYLLQACRA